MFDRWRQENFFKYMREEFPEEAEPGMRLAAQPFDDGLGDPRLADARLARDQHDGPVALLRLLPAPQE
jgi:hypothetical protein